MNDDRKPLQNITMGGGGLSLQGTSHRFKEDTASQMCNSGHLIEYPSYNVISSCRPIPTKVFVKNSTFETRSSFFFC